MSLSTVVLEGARRAATYAAMLFSLNAADPAAAQSSVTQPRAAMPLAVEGSVSDAGLTLAAHHFDVHIAGDEASVRTLLLLRNDTAAAISTQYVLPYPARVVRGDDWTLLGRDDISSLCDATDLSPAAAEQAETAPGRLAQRQDVIVVAPGEQITLEVLREVPVVATDGVRRLQLQLPVDRRAPWVPRFTADVLVEADRPIVRLESPTHEALVDGVGSRTALLSVADGFVYRQAQLAVEFEVDAAAQSTPVAALGGAPAARGR
jgi:hypothetical protein